MERTKKSAVRFFRCHTVAEVTARWKEHEAVERQKRLSQMIDDMRIETERVEKDRREEGRRRKEAGKCDLLAPAISSFEFEN